MRKVLNEEQRTNVDTSEIKYDSFDAIIDNLLADFENSTMKDDTQIAAESKSLRRLMRPLFEAEGDDPTDTPDAEAPADDAASAVPAEPEVKIDVAQFASKVARLAKNYQNFVDPRLVVLNRSFEFVKSTYGDAAAGKMMQILKKHHGLSTEEQTDQVNIPPPAKGAGPPVGGGI